MSGRTGSAASCNTTLLASLQPGQVRSSLELTLLTRGECLGCASLYSVVFVDVIDKVIHHLANYPLPRHTHPNPSRSFLTNSHSPPNSEPCLGHSPIIQLAESIAIEQRGCTHGRSGHRACGFLFCSGGYLSVLCRRPLHVHHVRHQQ